MQPEEEMTSQKSGDLINTNTLRAGVQRMEPDSLHGFGFTRFTWSLWFCKAQEKDKGQLAHISIRVREKTFL